MSKVHFIAMDTHSQTTDICVKTRANGPGKRYRVATTIPSIREVIEAVAGPRRLVFEEGPLADWLWRNLKDQVEEAVVCDPRRNGLVAKAGDKDDPIDAGKLCDLYIGGFVRAVHHPESMHRRVSKEAVGLYHDCVRQRVRQANQVMGLLKRWGIMAKEKDFSALADRAGLLAKLSGAVGDTQAGDLVAGHVAVLWRSYDAAVAEEQRMRGEIIALARREEQVIRWQALPGIGWIRGLTLLAHLDTPWRFKSKPALWKYLGIGLVREHSGKGPTHVRVEQGCNHELRGVIIGAAKTAIMTKAGEFYGQYKGWVESGLSYKNARRNVARSLAAVAWGMWKNGGMYDASQAGVAAQAVYDAKGGGRQSRQRALAGSLNGAIERSTAVD